MKPIIPAGRLVRGPPGVGKTTATAHMIRQCIDNGQRVGMSVERVDLAYDMPARVSRPDGLQLILGKRRDDIDGNPLCLAPDRLGGVEAGGFQEWESSLACDSCPSRSLCGHQKQFGTGKSIVFTSTLLRSSTFRKHELADLDLLVLDEGAWSAFCPDVEHVTSADLAKAIAHDIDLGALQHALSGEPSGRQYGRRVAHRLLSAPVSDGYAGMGGAGPSQRLWQLRAQLLEHNRGCLEAGQPSRLVPGRVARLLQILAEELRHPGPNSRLDVFGGKIEIRDPLVFKPPCRVLVLDGTGQKEVYEQLLGIPMEVVDPKLACHADVWQLVDGAYGRGSLLNNPKTLDRMLEAVRTIVSIRGAGPNPVGVITFKALHDDLHHALQGLNYRLGTYWAVRGSNAFLEQGVATIILMGTPTANIDDGILWAKARAWREKDPIDDAPCFSLRRYGMQFEPDKAIGVIGSRDPRVAGWSTMLREGELRQAAERVRSVIPNSEIIAGHLPAMHAGLADRQIWLLTNLPVPGLTPGELFNLDDVLH